MKLFQKKNLIKEVAKKTLKENLWEQKGIQMPQKGLQIHFSNSVKNRDKSLWNKLAQSWNLEKLNQLNRN